ncbi:MAG: substrate-binding domain-containing protein [Phototrophicaceae bacterium]
MPTTRFDHLMIVLLVSLLCFLHPDTFYAQSNEFIQEAQEHIEQATVLESVWQGPSTGPLASSGKLIVYIAADIFNDGVLTVSNGVQEAATVVGWDVMILDGLGTVEGRSSAFRRALHIMPDGIILGGFNATEQAEYLEEAARQGVPVVGWHAAAFPGALTTPPVFTNITTDPLEVATIAAALAIVESNGTANVVIFTDSNYEIALAKSRQIEATLRKCPTCQVLSVEDVALSETPRVMREVVQDLSTEYGEAWTYSIGINDLYYDFGFDILDKSLLPRNISAGDGSYNAYKRIAEGEHQFATVPEPLIMQGWQIIDELNRALAGESPSGYVAPVHVIYTKNIVQERIMQTGIFDPQNTYREQYRQIWLGQN